MPKKKLAAKQIVTKLRQVEVLQSKSATSACKEVGLGATEPDNNRVKTLLTTAQHDFCDEPIDCSDSIRRPFGCRLEQRKYGNNIRK
jgi:hypothetical protein